MLDMLIEDMGLDVNRPVYTLTVGEFIELQQRLQKTNGYSQQTHTESSRQYVYGISGIAELFKCSKSTAQRIKGSGNIDKAISQTGRKIKVDADLATELLRKKKSD